jgi:hypothetical protein
MQFVIETTGNGCEAFFSLFSSSMTSIFSKHFKHGQYSFQKFKHGQRRHQRMHAALSVEGASEASEGLHSSASRASVGSRVVMQMGGGCILYVEQPMDDDRRKDALLRGSSKKAANGAAAINACSGDGMHIRPANVFEALCDCVFASKK